MARNNLFLRVRAWFGHKYVEYLLLLLAFLEASVWFILPDFFLFLYAGFRPKHSQKFLVKVFASSVLGSFFYFVVCSFYPSISKTILFATPFVNPDDYQLISSLNYSHFWIRGLTQSASSVPVKIWTHVAVVHDWSVVVLLPIFVSRVVRMAGIVWLGRLFFGLSKKTIAKHTLAFLIGYVVLFFIGLVVSSR